MMGSQVQDTFLKEQLAQKDQMIRMQNETITDLRSTADNLNKTIDRLNGTIERMNSEMAGLKETLREFQRKLFGKSSEQTETGETEEEAPVATTVKSHTRTKRKAKATREDQNGNLPIRNEVIPLSEEDKLCPYCNTRMEKIGEVFVREELRITPAKVERVRYYQEKWICPACRKDGDGTFAASKVPMALIPHSPSSPSIVAYVAMEKIAMAMPYYRQENLMHEPGLTLPRETMANRIIYVSEHYFYPIYEWLHEELLKRDLIHADETTCQEK